MLLVIPVALIYHEKILSPILLSFAITMGTGLILFSFNKIVNLEKFTIKESFLITAFTWLIVPLFGTLPYLLSHSIPGFINAFFESVSGFTTTGSSILIDIEALPKGILFWRATTHWIGGMGIIVLVVAIMPYLKIGGSHLMIAEGSFFGVEKIKPKLIDVAKQLWLIYVILTAAETLLLTLAGMNLFDSICHSFATIATGGFSTKNSSIIDMSPTIQYIIIVFMTLSGINFTLHFFVLNRRFKPIFKDEELKAYLIIIFIITGILTLYVHKQYHDWENSFRQSLFQVSSIITATGFASADYELWPGFTHTILFLTMFIGACVGSTGGGIKVARYVIAFKQFKPIFKKMASPNSIVVTKYNGVKLTSPAIQSVFAFISVYFLTFVAGTLFMCFLKVDIITSASSVITTLGGIGPGFGAVGPVDNFFGLPDLGKLYLSFNMLMGRLEIFSFLVIFQPSFYRI